ncbi:MAG: hypothetical protein QS98_C0001G0008 [archaeon GW2011_AR3]|nr:MAG: hypothetical protein QS98_C0001G0008 [archaeon GW2011_AR3]MBS3109286.1 hypothetical protein [Candidatus Woesearchaeota archaeon]
MAWEDDKKRALRKAKELESKDSKIESTGKMKQEDAEFQKEARELKDMIFRKGHKK